MIYIWVYQAYQKKVGMMQKQGPCRSIKISVTARLNYNFMGLLNSRPWDPYNTLSKKDLHLEHHAMFSYAQTEIVKKILNSKQTSFTIMSIMFSLLFFMQIVTILEFFWASQKFIFASFTLYMCVWEWLFYFIEILS